MPLNVDAEIVFISAVIVVFVVVAVFVVFAVFVVDVVDVVVFVVVSMKLCHHLALSKARYR